MATTAMMLYITTSQPGQSGRLTIRVQLLLAVSHAGVRSGTEDSHQWETAPAR